MGAWHLVSDSGIMARVIADSINPNGDRLTTVEAVFNRWILAEVNTHRMLSRSSASSRAIPVSRVIRQVWADPAGPVHWGGNQAGMQARSELAGWRRAAARRIFRLARLPAIAAAWLLVRIGLHKQVANRILEPWVWHTAVLSATEWENFFRLRLHPDAQPEFQELARCVRDAMDSSAPRALEWGCWHQPYIEAQDWVNAARAAFRPGDDAVVPETALVSAARCAAVSYVRQGEDRDPRKDVALAARLRDSGHWSPFEHVAVACPGRWGNFIGFRQARKFYPGEDGRTPPPPGIGSGDG